jgi:hypothetical protein
MSLFSQHGVFGLICATAVLLLPISGCGSRHHPPSAPAVSSIPPLPATPGCYKYDVDPVSGQARQWTKIDCLSPKQAARLPHPTIGGSSAGIYGLPGPCVGACGTPPTGLISAASISIVFPFSTAGLYSLVDSGTGRNSFSVQMNTNPFAINCTLPTIGGGGLFGGTSCVTGDLGTVQITYQADPGPWFDPFGWFSTSALCIWNVDDTARNYSNSCVNIPPPYGNNQWVPGAVMQIIAGEANQNVWVKGCVPWASGSFQCFGHVAPDTLGLCLNAASSQCSWQGVSGSLLGEGNTSTATFPPGVTMVTTLATVSCTPPASYVIPFHPFPVAGMGFNPSSDASLPCPAPWFPASNTGSPATFGPGPGFTLETNNLIPQIAPASEIIQACFDGTCWYNYVASD